MIGLLAISLLSQAMDQAGVSEFWRFNCFVSKAGDVAKPRRIDAIYMLPKDSADGSRFDFRDPTNILDQPTGWAPAGNWVIPANGLPRDLTVWLASTETNPARPSVKHVDTEFSIALSANDEKSATLKLVDFHPASTGKVMRVEYSGECTVETGAAAYDRYFGGKE